MPETASSGHSKDSMTCQGTSDDSARRQHYNTARTDRRTPVDDQTRPSDDLPPEEATSGESSSGSGTASRTAHDTDARHNERGNLTPDMEAELPEAGAVPPGYDWPTHGGYLGCLLGMMPACLIGGFLGSTFVAWLNAAGVVPPVVAGLLVVALFVLSVIGFGRLGWILGRRFYRKYPQAQPSWGEDDLAPDVAAQGRPGEVRDQATR